MIEFLQAAWELLNPTLPGHISGALAPWVIPAILSGAGALGGAFSGRGRSTSQQIDRTTTPVLGQFAPLFSAAQSQMLGRQPIDISGLTAAGISNANQVAQLAQQGLENRLASQGLLGSPVAGAGLATLEAGRAGNIANFLNRVPLIAREQERADFAQLLGLLQSLPIGQRTQGTSTGQVGGNVLGGLFGGAGGMLGLLAGLGAIPGLANAGRPTDASGLGSLLTGLGNPGFRRP